MPRFEYKDGCLLCNECGRLNKPPDDEESTRAECPCGNSESLDAIAEIVDLYNKPHERDDRER
jgi:hypothetical protein